MGNIKTGNVKNFNPRAPHGARPVDFPRSAFQGGISIHALRMERDFRLPRKRQYRAISIHALRMERDCRGQITDEDSTISIHALRMERDDCALFRGGA